MDQLKIGKFIAECRKNKNLTQIQLAEKLNITDRAVSKWENGKSMPDSSIMLELCGLLGITVNDLLNGEVVVMEKYNEKTENLLIEIAKEKEMADKRLLSLEVVIAVLSLVILFGAVGVAAFFNMEEWIRATIIVAGMLVGTTGLLCALRIEQIAGYYECKACGHKYVPTYKAVNMAPHMGRTRYMKCPECHKKTWQKKVLNK